MTANFRPDMPTIKMESVGGDFVMNGGKVVVKNESEIQMLSPGVQSEEDIYEDAGDLDFTNAAQEVYLMRVPKFLWKSWSQLEDNDEIRIGTIRVVGELDNPEKMSLLLASEIAANQNIPKEYNMETTNGLPTNTFVFTEQDLPGYHTKSKSSSRHAQLNGSLPFSQVAPRLGMQDRGKLSVFGFDKNKKRQPYYRRAIPKKTALVGQIRREINCLAVENQEYRHLMEDKALRALSAKRETQFLSGRASANAGNLLAPGTLGAPGGFNNFIKPTGTQRNKPQDGTKAARMPQNELLDVILDCFKRFQYWPLKTLKAELNQPEAYLRETLEKVAHLVKMGPYAMTWQLKQTFNLGSYAGSNPHELVPDQVAPDNSYRFDGNSDTGEGNGSEDEDEHMRLEDIMPK